MSPCWEWIGQIDRYGYGRRSGRLAHRLVYEWKRGPIPTGLQLDHLCRNRRCVNPEHLEPVTNATNQARGFQATKTHCQNGHPFDLANTYRGVRGGRGCRACSRDAQRRHRDHSKEKVQ